MRISDWSSDVCSSDLFQGRPPASGLPVGARQDRPVADHRGVHQEAARAGPSDQARPPHRPAPLYREESRADRWTSSCSNVSRNWAVPATSYPVRTTLPAISFFPTTKRSEARRVGKEGDLRDTNRVSPK